MGRRAPPSCLNLLLDGVPLVKALQVEVLGQHLWTLHTHSVHLLLDAGLCLDSEVARSTQHP